MVCGALARTHLRWVPAIVATHCSAFSPANAKISEIHSKRVSTVGSHPWLLFQSAGIK